MAGIEKVVENAILTAAKEVEQQVDREIDRLDNLQDDDLDAIRERRLAQMKKAAEDRAVWRRNGHGTLNTIAEKDFFNRAKETKRMLVILHRPGSSRYASELLEHMTKLAQHHLETFFASLDANKAPFLCDRLNIRIIPSVIFVKDGEIDKVLMGLDHLSPTGKFTTISLEKTLFDMGVITNTNIADDS